MSEASKPAPDNLPREERKLRALREKHPDPKELSGEAAGTSEETAELFSSTPVPTPHNPPDTI
jgi:hypothetical protein